jgi:predicted  nucleic acid-binding Zn-ribbon protein
MRQSTFHIAKEAEFLSSFESRGGRFGKILGGLGIGVAGTTGAYAGHLKGRLGKTTEELTTAKGRINHLENELVNSNIYNNNKDSVIKGMNEQLNNVKNLNSTKEKEFNALQNEYKALQNKYNDIKNLVENGEISKTEAAKRIKRLEAENAFITSQLKESESKLGSNNNMIKNLQNEIVELKNTIAKSASEVAEGAAKGFKKLVAGDDAGIIAFIKQNVNNGNLKVPKDLNVDDVIRESNIVKIINARLKNNPSLGDKENILLQYIKGPVTNTVKSLTDDLLNIATS